MKDSDGNILKDGDIVVTDRGAELSIVVDSGVYYAFALGNEEAILLSGLTVSFSKK